MAGRAARFGLSPGRGDTGGLDARDRHLDARHGRHWYRLGFVVDTGDGKPVETERTVVCRTCTVIIDRNEIGKEEAVALVEAADSIVDGFFVVVEGFAPSDLGITTATPTLAQLSAWAPTVTLSPTPMQMTAAVNDMLLENNGALGQAQRITFGYNITFTGANDFTTAVVPVQVTATIQGVGSSGIIDLTPIDSPYMGPPSGERQSQSAVGRYQQADHQSGTKWQRSLHVLRVLARYQPANRSALPDSACAARWRAVHGDVAVDRKSHPRQPPVPGERDQFRSGSDHTAGSVDRLHSEALAAEPRHRPLGQSRQCRQSSGATYVRDPSNDRDPGAQTGAR